MASVTGVGLPGYEIRMSETYNKDHKSLMQLYKQVIMFDDYLDNRFSDLLPIMKHTEARGLSYGLYDIERFAGMYLTHILSMSYNVWDESHARYPVLLERIKDLVKECPFEFSALVSTWEDEFVRIHERKVKNCKVRVFPIK